jgi:hypothetical protein
MTRDLLSLGSRSWWVFPLCPMIFYVVLVCDRYCFVYLTLCSCVSLIGCHNSISCRYFVFAINPPMRDRLGSAPVSDWVSCSISTLSSLAKKNFEETKPVQWWQTNVEKNNQNFYQRSELRGSNWEYLKWFFLRGLVQGMAQQSIFQMTKLT